MAVGRGGPQDVAGLVIDDEVAVGLHRGVGAGMAVGLGRPELGPGPVEQRQIAVGEHGQAICLGRLGVQAPAGFEHIALDHLVDPARGRPAGRRVAVDDEVAVVLEHESRAADRRTVGAPDGGAGGVVDDEVAVDLHHRARARILGGARRPQRAVAGDGLRQVAVAPHDQVEVAVGRLEVVRVAEHPVGAQDARRRRGRGGRRHHGGHEQPGDARDEHRRAAHSPSRHQPSGGIPHPAHRFRPFLYPEPPSSCAGPVFCARSVRRGPARWTRSSAGRAGGLRSRSGSPRWRRRRPSRR